MKGAVPDFNEWLLQQAGRIDNSCIGDLAADTVGHVRQLELRLTTVPLPSPREGRAGWVRFLELHNACRGAHKAFNAAWSEWSRLRKTAQHE